MFALLRRFLQPIGYDADCRFAFVCKGEELCYTDRKHVVSFERTHCRG